MISTRLAATLLIAIYCSGIVTAQSHEYLTKLGKGAGEAMAAGRFDEAARLYGDMVRTLPANAGLQMNLGMALAMAGREDEAIAPLERAIALDPSLIPAFLFLGTSHLARGDAAKAVAPLERAAAAQPRDIE